MNTYYGCPNCQDETSSFICNKSSFNMFKPLKKKGFYGTETELLECERCQALWIEINGGHLRHLLYPTAKEFFFRFYDSGNRVSMENENVLRDIGSTKHREMESWFPATVLTKSGILIQRVIIVLKKFVWPISMLRDNVFFLSEIEDILKSKEAMTLKQRQALSLVEEFEMGSSFLFLERNEERFMIRDNNLFIPSFFGKPDEFKIVPNDGKHKKIIHCNDIKYFVGFSDFSTIIE